MIFSNVNDLYRGFLDGIRKTATRTVKPAQFARIWNQYALMDWITNNPAYNEDLQVTDKMIEDHQSLFVPAIINPISTNRFKIPDGSFFGYYEHTGNDKHTLPECRRVLGVMFSLNYGTASNQECGLTGISEWLRATFLKSRTEGVIRTSAYRKPKDSNLYYKRANNEIYMVTDPNAGSNADQIKLDYFKVPNKITESDDVLSYTFDLKDEQLQEILTSAVRIHLENINSPRYQSFLNEEVARQ